MHKTVDRSQSWVYILHDVVVCSGELDGGHYYSFVKPNSQTRWMKFDDERVTPATDREVFDEGSSSSFGLVYIRKSKSDELLSPLKKLDTPPVLSK
jgi:ubiquitin carboxyl-terminal hydrolase 7